MFSVTVRVNKKMQSGSLHALLVCRSNKDMPCSEHCILALHKRVPRLSW
jgi:hypothetical protein